MASSTVHHHFICHFCFDEFPDDSSLLSHFSHCHTKNSTKRKDESNRLPRLNKTDRDMLHMLKLHQLNDKYIPHKSKTQTDSYLHISLSMNYIPYSKQSSFDDSICTTTNSLLTNDDQSEEENISNSLNTKSVSSSSYHTYKYSRREQKNFYASVKRARLKKQYIPYKKSRMNSLIFDKKNSLISLPTKITSRQRLNTNSNNSYPLIFDPNFHSLVQISTNNLFENYLSDINIYFHLIHSIASQEFQIIVNSNDTQHHVSYTAFSFLNVLRQTMTEYTASLQKTFKRNYFQSFQHQDQQIMTPYKIPRYDQSTSLSSSLIQLDDNHTENNLPPSTTTIRNNFIQIDDNNSVSHPIPSDLILVNHRQSTDRTNTEPILSSFIPIIEEQKSSRKSPSPFPIREQKLEPIEIDEPIYPNQRTPIRLMNGSNTTTQKASSRKKLSNSIKKPDENSVIKPTRMSSRLHTIKTEVIPEVYPTFETKPVILSSSQISKEWLTHNVFYRCHACSHEEFFLVLSRECMNLHISSQHGNMEENFKQRLSSFLTNKGRTLKIFQHFLKWQHPWSEKQIEQIFKLSNK